MLYKRRLRFNCGNISHLHLQQEKTSNRITGYGLDGYMRLCDEDGNVWAGVVELGADDQVRCRLKDQRGRNLTGMADAGTWTFRDDHGNVWKGFAG